MLANMWILSWCPVCRASLLTSEIPPNSYNTLRGSRSLRTPSSWLSILRLCTRSIPHEQGVRMVGFFLGEQDTTTWPLNSFILKCLYFILTKNYFTFNNQLFLQTQGVAMGTSHAPSYVNLYLGGWERYIHSWKIYRFSSRYTSMV